MFPENHQDHKDCSSQILISISEMLAGETNQFIKLGSIHNNVLPVHLGMQLIVLIELILNIVTFLKRSG